tara:strand:+ start:626 stop:988 length:363 start_codon:yes stop_codon:yes gene_type:complete
MAKKSDEGNKPVDHSGNGWGEWSNHVLIELNRLNSNYERIHSKMDTIDNKLNKFEGLKYSVDEIKVWKKEIEAVVTPSDLKELTEAVWQLKAFKTQVITVGVIMQILMGLLVVFKDDMFK